MTSPAGKPADAGGTGQAPPPTTAVAGVVSSVSTPKTPPRVARAAKKSVSPSKKKVEPSVVATATEPTSTSSSSDHQQHQVDARVAALEQQLLRTRNTADARRKEADSLRKRVQELEPQVHRLEKELKEKRTTIERLAGRQQPGPKTTASQAGEGDVALRGRLTAAENRARALQLRCDHLEHERGCSWATKAGSERKDKMEEEDHNVPAHERANGNENGNSGGGGGPRAKDSSNDNEAKRISRQLEVAERRVKNSLYINEAHESLAAKATAGEREANARTAELGRKLNRTLEKLESIERRDMIASLQASCVRDEEGIHLTERELRANQMDPELDLPVNTAKRRQLARSEQHLRRLRLRHESQTAALTQAQSMERLHSDLRRAAGCGNISETVACMESGISVNVPDQNGLSAFLYACGQENAELIRVMIDAGGDVLDGDGTITGLIIAARKVSVEWSLSTINSKRCPNSPNCTVVRVPLRSLYSNLSHIISTQSYKIPTRIQSRKMSG